MKSVSALPTIPGANPWTDVNFQAYYSIPVDLNTFTAKIDQIFSEKDNLSGRITRSVRGRKVLGGQYGYPPPGSTDAGGTGRSESNVYSAFTRWNHVFTPAFLNEFQASAHRSNNSSGTLGDDVNWANKLKAQVDTSSIVGISKFAVG